MGMRTWFKLREWWKNVGEHALQGRETRSRVDVWDPYPAAAMAAKSASVILAEDME